MRYGKKRPNRTCGSIVCLLAANNGCTKRYKQEIDPVGVAADS